jgi:hypothetical protein
MQEALFTVHHEAYPHYELGRFNILITLKMKAIYSSKTSVLIIVTWYKVPEDIFHFSN